MHWKTFVVADVPLCGTCGRNPISCDYHCIISKGHIPSNTDILETTCILGRTYFVERSINLIEEHWLLIITGVQASTIRWSCLMSVVLQFRTIRNSTVAINDQWLLLKPGLLWYSWNRILFPRISLPSTRNQWIRSPKPHYFETALQSGLIPRPHESR